MDISDKVFTQLLLVPQTTTVANVAVGTGFNRLNYEGAIIACSMGSAMGSPAGVYTVTFQVKDSDDDSTYTEVTSGLSSGVAVITNTQTRKEIALDLLPLKKYVKVDATGVFTSGTTPYVAVSALGILSGAKVQPV